MATRGRRAIGEVLPGMPLIGTEQPPKARDDEWKTRTLDEAIARSREIVADVMREYNTGDVISTGTFRKGKNKGKTYTRNLGPREIEGVYSLYSGGKDSVNLAHLFRNQTDGIIHVNTGTAIAETTNHVRDVAKAWGLPLHELHPRDNYLDLCLGKVLATTGENIGRPVWKGFPGPGSESHQVMYRRLKDEPLQRFRAEKVGRDGARKKVIYLAGMRWAESDKRFRNAEAVDPEGGIIWVSPVVHWTDEHMQEYRERYRCHLNHDHAPHRMCTPNALPLNEVAANLHMSGDCTCGCYARPGEIEQIEFFYPDKAKQIRKMEAKVAAAGITACRWGQRTPESIARRAEEAERKRSAKAEARKLRLCSTCAPPLEGQVDLMDEWREAGLISDDQYDRLTGSSADAEATSGDDHCINCGHSRHEHGDLLSWTPCKHWEPVIVEGEPEPIADRCSCTRFSNATSSIESQVATR